VGLVYDPRGLSGVTIIRPEVARMLHLRSDNRCHHVSSVEQLVNLL
jgi:hypothetical protein